MVRSVVCPVCGGVMVLSRGPVGLMDSADRWGECASCGAEALVSWSLSGRVVELSSPVDRLEGLCRLVDELEEESEWSSWRVVSAGDLSAGGLSVVWCGTGGRVVRVGRVELDGGAVVAENMAGVVVGRLILWESWEEVSEWITGSDPNCSAGFPVGSVLARRRR